MNTMIHFPTHQIRVSMCHTSADPARSDAIETRSLVVPYGHYLAAVQLTQHPTHLTVEFVFRRLADAPEAS